MRRWHGFVALVAVSTLVFADPRVTPPAEGLRVATPRVFAFTHAHVVIEGGNEIDDATLVIRDGKIDAVGKNISPPADARVVDCTGKTIYPGFIDAFSELPTEASKADPAIADGTAAGYWNPQITPQIDAARLYKPDAKVNESFRSVGFVARLIAPSRGIIKGSGAVVQTSNADASQAMLNDHASMHAVLTVPRGNNSAGTDEDRYPTSPMGALTLVRQAFYDARWYVAAKAHATTYPSLPSPERNDALAAIARVTELKTPIVVDAENELFALRADKIGREFDLPIVIRGSGREYRLLDAVAAAGRAIIVPMNFPKPPNVASLEAATGASLEELMHWDLAPENAARLQSRGLMIALTSNGLKDRSQFLPAMRKAVLRGLSRDDALRAITTTPAKLFAVDRSLGTLERAKVASFVIADGDLFAEKTKVLETWVAGEKFAVAPPAAVADPRGTFAIMPTTQPLTLKIDGEPNKLTGKISGERDLSPTTSPTTSPSSAPATSPATAASTQSATKPASVSVDLTGVQLYDTQLVASFKGDAVLGVKGVAQLSATVEAGRLTGAILLPNGERVAFVATTLNSSTTRASTTRSAASAAAIKASTSQASSQPATKPTTQASYPPNYPFGEYGREGLPEQPGYVLIRNVTIWTCAASPTESAVAAAVPAGSSRETTAETAVATSTRSADAGVIENGQVVINAGKIVYVGKPTPRTPPIGAVIIDGHGMHLSPGVIDCHSHMATDGGINESGQAVTAEVRIGDFINPEDITIYRQLAGGVTSSNILHGSANPIGGQNQVIKCRWGAGPEEMKFQGAMPGIKFALGENVKQSNWGEKFTSRYPQTRLGVEEIDRDAFRAAIDYRRLQKLFAEHPEQTMPPRVDLELEAVAEIVEGNRLIHCHSYRQDEILMLLRLCESFGIKIGTLQHILEGYKVADAMKAHGVGASTFSDWWAYKFEVYDAIPDNGAILHEQGISVSFNSDDAEMGRRLNWEAAKAMKYGRVSPTEALKFVTLNPAVQLHIDSRVGSIEVGKDADLALWSGAPLSSMSRCEQTWVDGRKLFDRADDLAMRKRDRERKAALIQKVLASGEAMAGPDDDAGNRPTIWATEDEFDEVRK